MSAFAQATRVRRRPGEPTYDVDLDLGWSIGGRPNGGYLMALLANAGLDAVERPHVLAASGHFLLPPDGGPAEVRVEVLKSGRTASTVRATLWQNQRACLDLLVTAGELPKDDADYLSAVRPDLPLPDQCRARAEDDMPIELLDHVDVRLDPSTAPFNGNLGTPVIRGWMRFHDGAEADALALLLAVDVCPPTVFRLGRFGWAPTVELTCLLRGVPEPGWLAFEATATAVIGGWFDESANVWDETGRLVAQSRQLALIGRPSAAP